MTLDAETSLVLAKLAVGIVGAVLALTMGAFKSMTTEIEWITTMRHDASWAGYEVIDMPSLGLGGESRLDISIKSEGGCLWAFRNGATLVEIEHREDAARPWTITDHINNRQLHLKHAHKARDRFFALMKPLARPRGWVAESSLKIITSEHAP